jgi:hypothetical protein
MLQVLRLDPDEQLAISITVSSSTGQRFSRLFIRLDDTRWRVW